MLKIGPNRRYILPKQPSSDGTVWFQIAKTDGVHWAIPGRPFRFHRTGQIALKTGFKRPLCHLLEGEFRSSWQWL